MSEWPRARFPCFIWVGDTGKPWEASWSVHASRLQGAYSSVPSGPQDSANDTHTLPRLPQNPACVSHPLGFSFSSSYCCCDLLGVDSPGSTRVAPRLCLACPKTSLLTQRQGLPWGPHAQPGIVGAPCPVGIALCRGRLKPGDAFLLRARAQSEWYWSGGTWWLLCWLCLLPATFPGALTPRSLWTMQIPGNSGKNRLHCQLPSGCPQECAEGSTHLLDPQEALFWVIHIATLPCAPCTSRTHGMQATNSFNI